MTEGRIGTQPGLAHVARVRLGGIEQLFQSCKEAEVAVGDDEGQDELAHISLAKLRAWQQENPALTRALADARPEVGAPAG